MQSEVGLDTTSTKVSPQKELAHPRNLLRALLGIQPSMLTVFIAMAILYFAIQPPEFLTTDGYMRELVARNLLDYGDPALVQVERGETLNNLWSYGNDGRPYTYFGLGQSLLLIPFMLLIKMLNDIGIGQFLSPTIGLPMAIVMSLSAAALVTFMFGIVRELGYERRTALITAALVGFASTLWVMARSSFDMTIDAAMLMGALYCVIAAQRHEEQRIARLIAGGALFGFAVVTRVGALMAGPALAMLLLLEPERSWAERFKMAVWFGIGSMLLVWIVPYYNWYRYGSIMEFGYAGHYPYSGGPLLRGILMWVVSPWEGALVYMPLLLALPLLWRRFYAKHGHIARVLVVLFLTVLLFHAQMVGLGNSGWGPYYVMSAIFPAYVVFAEISEVRVNWQRGLIGGLAALTLAIQLMSIALPFERYQTERVVFHVNDELGGFEKFNFWSMKWSPLARQSAGTFKMLGNMLHYHEFLDSPPSFSAQDLLDQLYSYNLPDWWWLFKLLHGSEIAILVPLIAGMVTAWMIAHMVIRHDTATQVA